MTENNHRIEQATRGAFFNFSLFINKDRTFFCLTRLFIKHVVEFELMLTT